MRHSGLPPNVTEFRDRHGKWRLRFRAKGRPTYYFKARPGTEEFRAELDVCRAGSATAPGASSRHVEAGTMGALISLYYGTPAFTGLAASSKKDLPEHIGALQGRAWLEACGRTRAPPHQGDHRRDGGNAGGCQQAAR